MDYVGAREYIKGLNSRGISPGLNSITQLLNELNNPQNSLKFIHIAGTNGKGSVGAYLSSVLTAEKKKVCSFVSPCVGEYLNTFLLNGKPIDKKTYVDAAKSVKSAIEVTEKRGVFPTSFEAETAIAFVLFSRLEPDYAIIECGMGGRLDATNVIPPPVAAVITKIALDHTAFLGNTIEEIAKEKAGIIKNGTKVVTTCENESVLNILKEKAKETNSELYISPNPSNIKYSRDFTFFDLYHNMFKTKMLGTYQPQNASLAITVARALGISFDAIKRGISEASWDFRFEKINKFILDGAHNPDGAKELARSIKTYYGDKLVTYIFGCFADKDYGQIIDIVYPYADTVYCVTAPTPRGLSSKIIAEEFTSRGVKPIECQSIFDAILYASKHSDVVIFGTLSILSQAKDLIERNFTNATMQ